MIKLNLQANLVFLLVVAVMLNACTHLSGNDNKKYIPIQEAIDLEMKVWVEAAHYKKPIRIAAYKDDMLLAADCNGNILKLEKEDVVRAWTDFSGYMCNYNHSFKEDDNNESELPDTNRFTPIAIINDVSSGSIRQKVQVDGSNSYDPRGSKIAFQWRFISKPNGSASKLDYPELPNPSFIPDLDGIYILELVVTNEFGVASTPNTVIFAPNVSVSELYSEELAGIGEGILKLIILVLFLSLL